MLVPAQSCGRRHMCNHDEVCEAALSQTAAGIQLHSQIELMLPPGHKAAQVVTSLKYRPGRSQLGIPDGLPAVLVALENRLGLYENLQSNSAQQATSFMGLCSCICYNSILVRSASNPLTCRWPRQRTEHGGCACSVDPCRSPSRLARS